MNTDQNFANHTRWLAPYHFVLAPIMLANFIFAIVRLVMDFNVDRIGYLVLAIALVMLTLLARTHSLTVQDRVIRLEERLRYRELLPAELAEKAVDLKPAQMVSLRFASDSELPALIERTLKGEFEKAGDIKKEIKNWRGDYLRA